MLYPALDLFVYLTRFQTLTGWYFQLFEDFERFLVCHKLGRIKIDKTSILNDKSIIDIDVIDSSSILILPKLKIR